MSPEPELEDVPPEAAPPTPPPPLFVSISLSIVSKKCQEYHHHQTSLSVLKIDEYVYVECLQIGRRQKDSIFVHLYLCILTGQRVKCECCKHDKVT